MMQKEQLTRDQVDNFLRDWILEEQGGTEEEVEELREGLTPDMLDEANFNIVSQRLNVPEALFEVLVEEGLMADDEDLRNAFVDYYEAKHA